MTFKARDTMTKYVITAHLDMSVREARSIMTESEIRHLPVVHNDKIVGIISDRDLMNSEDFNTKGDHITVTDVMTIDPICGSPQTTLLQISQLMIQNKIDSVPIVDNKNILIGLVTSTDILELFARGQVFNQEEKVPWEYCIKTRNQSY